MHPDSFLFTRKGGNMYRLTGVVIVTMLLGFVGDVWAGACLVDNETDFKVGVFCTLTKTGTNMSQSNNIHNAPPNKVSEFGRKWYFVEKVSIGQVVKDGWIARHYGKEVYVNGEKIDSQKVFKCKMIGLGVPWTANASIRLWEDGNRINIKISFHNLLNLIIERPIYLI